MSGAAAKFAAGGGLFHADGFSQQDIVRSVAHEDFKLAGVVAEVVD